MPQYIARRTLLLLPLALLAACGSGHQTAARLDDRLQTSLAPHLAAGRASLQTLPDGARVTLFNPSLFPVNTMALDDKYPDIRADLIEALLDPSLMRVEVTDTTNLPDDQRRQRVDNIRQFFTDNGLAEVLQPANPLGQPQPSQVQIGGNHQAQAAAAQPGLTLTIGLYCPHRHDGSGYGDGLSKPVCD